jgi:hypothetical protein
MQQLSVPFAEKLDEPLAELCNGGRGLVRSERIPVLVRCHADALAEVAALVARLGGTVRHQLRLVSALAAWIPLCAVQALAQDDAVRHLELEQSFTAA